MSGPTISFPGEIFLANYADGEHDELKQEPVIAEPKEKIGAKDDRDGAETGDPAVAPRPAEKHVQRIDKDDLDQDEWDVVEDLAPVPSPIGIEAGVHDQLHIMRGLGQELQCERPAGGADTLP